MTLYSYLDAGCTQPDPSTPPAVWGPTLGCSSGIISEITDGRPPHPYAYVVKQYYYPNCMGSPEIMWYVQHLFGDGKPFCVFTRDPDYPSTNVPFWMDCQAGTYAVFTSDDNSYCNNDMQYYLTSGSLQNFRYEDKCLADYEYPITPHMKVTCAGQFSP
jgi:hypothetical protein